MDGKMTVFDDQLFNRSGCGHCGGSNPDMAY
jgi:hypothetical protein